MLRLNDCQVVSPMWGVYPCPQGSTAQGGEDGQWMRAEANLRPGPAHNSTQGQITAAMQMGSDNTTSKMSHTENTRSDWLCTRYPPNSRTLGASLEWEQWH